jgi:chromosome partitioning protein
MKTWAVANQKGGVGKTTTAVTLGGLLALRGSQVLLVDMDPHGSLTTYFGMDPDAVSTGVYTLFQQAANGRPLSPNNAVVETAFKNLHVMPAATAMATLDRQLGTREGMGLVLKKSLERMADRYEYALLDCPPMLGVLMVNALAACEHLLIPVQTEFLAIKGLERMLHTLGMIQRSRRFQLNYTIIPTLFDRRTRSALQSLYQLRQHHPQETWNGVIPVDTQFREASTVGQPLPMMDPEARGVQAYRTLLEDLESAEPSPNTTVAI